MRAMIGFACALAFAGCCAPCQPICYQCQPCQRQAAQCNGGYPRRFVIEIPYETQRCDCQEKRARARNDDGLASYSQQKFQDCHPVTEIRRALYEITVWGPCGPVDYSPIEKPGPGPWPIQHQEPY